MQPKRTMNIMKRTEELNKILGSLACFVAYVIFGINMISCKDLSNSHIISPFALFTMRAIGASALFWLVSLFCPKEKIELRDYPKIFCAAFLGIFLTQLSFLMAIPDTTPVVCSIFSTLTPIYTMFVAAIAIKEPITWKKAGGVLLSFVGIVFLILNSTSTSSGEGENSLQGIILLILNGVFFALYLGLFKPLIQKYSVVHFMKWVFLFCVLMSFPFTCKEVVTFDYGSLNSSYLFDLLFLVVCATFISYYLIPFGQKYIRPTVVSLFTYVQPMFAITISIAVGMDTFSWQKAVATVMVFGGILLVTFSKSAASMLKKNGD